MHLNSAKFLLYFAKRNSFTSMDGGSFGNRSKFSRPGTPLHNLGPLEGENPREGQSSSSS